MCRRNSPEYSLGVLWKSVEEIVPFAMPLYTLPNDLGIQPLVVVVETAPRSRPPPTRKQPTPASRKRNATMHPTKKRTPVHRRHRSKPQKEPSIVSILITNAAMPWEEKKTQGKESEPSKPSEGAQRRCPDERIKAEFMSS